MNKIAFSGPAAPIASAVQDAPQASLSSDAEPTGATPEGGIFDDLALLGALVFGVDQAEIDGKYPQ